MHYSDDLGFKAITCNGIITYVLSNRNLGKTWLFKKRAFKRALKHSKKTIWLRPFAKDAKENAKVLFDTEDLKTFCGISEYNKENNPNGNFKQVGKTCFYRYKPGRKWHWFLKVFSLTDASAIRGIDDKDIDTIIVDEASIQDEKARYYPGNYVDDLIDIFISLKREHQVRIFLLGNKESVNNQILAYFGVPKPNSVFEGIRKYRNGTFILQQINNLPDETNPFEKRVKDLLIGTQYGNFLYESKYKNQSAFKTRKTPANSTIYAQLVYNNQPIKISVLNGFYYVNNRILKNGKERIYTNAPSTLPNYYTLTKRQRIWFDGLVNGYYNNRIYYDSENAYVALQPFLKWLGLT